MSRGIQILNLPNFSCNYFFFLVLHSLVMFHFFNMSCTSIETNTFYTLILDAEDTYQFWFFFLFSLKNCCWGNIKRSNALLSIYELNLRFVKIRSKKFWLNRTIPAKVFVGTHQTSDILADERLVQLLMTRKSFRPVISKRKP